MFLGFGGQLSLHLRNLFRRGLLTWLELERICSWWGALRCHNGSKKSEVGSCYVRGDKDRTLLKEMAIKCSDSESDEICLPPRQGSISSCGWCSCIQSATSLHSTVHMWQSPSKHNPRLISRFDVVSIMFPGHIQATQAKSIIILL